VTVNNAAVTDPDLAELLEALKERAEIERKMDMLQRRIEGES
jgi:hypothetical protein